MTPTKKKKKNTQKTTKKEKEKRKTSNYINKINQTHIQFSPPPLLSQ
jgi:hypothetical protein